MTNDPTAEIATHYRQAFRDFGSVALLSMRPARTQPARTRSPSRRPCARLAAWTDGGSPSGSRRSAVPITKFQPDVTALDRYHRNPGAPRSFWPSSSEISRAMLERYGDAKS